MASATISILEANELLLPGKEPDAPGTSQLLTGPSYYYLEPLDRILERSKEI